MTELLYKSDIGIIFEKQYESGDDACSVIVRNPESNEILRLYEFKNVPEFKSPYLSWENLNCCGGWTFDEMYLYTAVQEGKKLFAGICLTIYDESWKEQCPEHNLTYENDVLAITEKLKRELPPDCIMGRDGNDAPRYKCTLRYYYICKQGALEDYIDMAAVLCAYDALGFCFDESTVSNLKEFAKIPLYMFGAENNSPFSYADPSSAAELIFVGLLLGYPIESTASLLMEERLFEEYKNSISEDEDEDV